MAKRKREKRRKTPTSWQNLLSNATNPLLLVNGERQVAFANQALADWVGLPIDRIIGRFVEYHSERAFEGSEEGSELLSGLCPPPAALAGNHVRGTLASVGRDGRLHHRRGEFLPIGVEGAIAVLAVLENVDLTVEEMAKPSSATDADSLHRQLRQLRRDAKKRYSLASLVGESTCMKRARAQVEVAARSRAHSLIIGPARSGRSHVAKAIHYTATSGTDSPLVELNCRILTEELLRKGVDSLHRDTSSLPTLLLIDIDELNDSVKSQFADQWRQLALKCQIIATIERKPTAITLLDDELLSIVAMITIELFPLSKRREDIPLLTQFFLEEANVDNPRQVGSTSAEVFEWLTLYSWPGEIAELRETIYAAHANCSGGEIQVSDLSTTLHHAAQAAQFAELPTEMIALDEFLAGIESELILRALEQSQGNKALAARLLGMTRPRLYRRLVQLNLTENSAWDLDPEDDSSEESAATEE